MAHAAALTRARPWLFVEGPSLARSFDLARSLDMSRMCQTCGCCFLTKRLAKLETCAHRENQTFQHETVDFASNERRQGEITACDGPCFTKVVPRAHAVSWFSRATLAENMWQAVWVCGRFGQSGTPLALGGSVFKGRGGRRGAKNFCRSGAACNLMTEG